MAPRLWTVGHSTQSLDQFLGLLRAHDIEGIADVRRFPGSRRYPHFAGEVLAQSLAARGVGYDWFPELGGRRTPLPDSVNSAWRNAGFRGYADYMATEALPRAWRDWRIWGVASGPPSCAPRPSGGGVTEA